jgi:hypothetical protein
MTATAKAAKSDSFTIDYNESTKIIITRYGIANTSEPRFSAYSTERYSYHVERIKDGKLTRTNEHTGYKSWEDALSDAQWYDC